jgi:hypothetical protein
MSSFLSSLFKQLALLGKSRLNSLSVLVSHNRHNAVRGRSWIADRTWLDVRSALLQSLNNSKHFVSIERSVPFSILAAIGLPGAAAFIAEVAIRKMDATAFAAPIFVDVVAFDHRVIC